MRPNWLKQAGLVWKTLHLAAFSFVSVFMVLNGHSFYNLFIIIIFFNNDGVFIIFFSSNDGSQPLKTSVLNKIRNDLHLNMEGDFRIILAIAEKLRPGIFFFLKGARRRDLTKNVEIL